jgi:hypothetical protein
MSLYDRNLSDKLLILYVSRSKSLEVCVALLLKYAKMKGNYLIILLAIFVSNVLSGKYLFFLQILTYTYVLCKTYKYTPRLYKYQINAAQLLGNISEY